MDIICELVLLQLVAKKGGYMQTLICLYTGCICLWLFGRDHYLLIGHIGSLKMYLKWTLDIAWDENLKSPTISLNLASGVLACKGRLFNEQVRTLPGTQGSGVGKVLPVWFPCLSGDASLRCGPQRSTWTWKPVPSLIAVSWGIKGRRSPLLSQGGGRTLTSSFGPSQQLPVRAPALPCFWRPEESAGVRGL